MITRILQRWAGGKDGSTAVEFSLVALPFILMVIGVIEMALLFTAASLLESSTGTAARLIRTGQLQQSAGDQQAAFRESLCDNSDMFLQCDNLQFEVTTIPEDNFGGAAAFGAPAFDVDGNLEPVGFSTGGANDIVLVRVVYRYPVVTPIMQPILVNSPDNTRLLMSTAVFQTEPYEFGED